MNALNINSYHSPTKFLQPANLTTYTILSLFSLQVELAPLLLIVTLARPSVSSSLHHQPLFHICITLPVESALFFIPSTSFCSLHVLLVHLILRISPHHSHHLRSHHLSLQTKTHLLHKSQSISYIRLPVSCQ